MSKRSRPRSSSTDSKTAVGVLLGAALITAVVFSPAGDQGFFAIVLLGPLATGLAAGALGRDWRPAAATWALVGVFMLAYDWIAHDEDKGVHVVLTLFMTALVWGSAGLVRAVRRVRQRRTVLDA